MVNDAEKFKAEDEKIKETIESRNELESLTFSLRNTITEGKLKIDDADKKTLEDKIKETIEWLESIRSNTAITKDEFEAKKKELEDISNPIMMKAY
jgi:L1 cell adhesion molecule like protein